MLLEAEERAYLEQVKAALGREIERLLEKAEGCSKDSYEAVRYMWEHREEFDNSEMLFNRNIAEGIADVGNETKRQLSRMVKLLDSPYFAGIDFLMENETEPMKVYIGKFSFFDRTDICRIYDWRSPVASMYYEFEDGEAYYDAPVGRICGRLTGKRQYKISRGVLEGVYESSSNIRDEILLQTLAQTSDTKMRDIAATIQKEQNALIRNETAEILIVQGVAGSGKTSVALHRIAYFLYRYRKEISAENFLILSPNGVFVDYISNVLPELGEERVRCMEMDDVARGYLPDGIRWEKLCRQPEKFVSREDAGWLMRNGFKASGEFVGLLEQYCSYCDNHLFVPKDYPYEGGVISEGFIRRCYERKRSMPVYLRLKETADEMAQEIKSTGQRSGMGTRKAEILEWLKSRLVYGDCLTLYESFYRHINRQELFCYEKSGILESADVFPLIYVKLYLEGSDGTDVIRYLVIDEMQDYTPIQYAVINKLYPGRKTLLGDFSQRICPYTEETMRFLERLYPNAVRLQLNKSYRCTCEIMEFALKIRPCKTMELVERHGEAVNVICNRTHEEEREELLKRVEESLRLEENFKLGILCKSLEQAQSLERWLAERVSDRKRLHLFNYDSREFYDGVIVTSVALAKGLEFDSVLVPDADSGNYATEYDIGLLYVACTRAMHRLTVLYCGGENRKFALDFPSP